MFGHTNAAMATTCGYVLQRLLAAHRVGNRKWTSTSSHGRFTWKAAVRHACQSDVSGSSALSFRSHTCGQLRREHVGEKVTLCGWVQYLRQDLFVILRDFSGLTQVLIPQEESARHVREALRHLTVESVIKVTGTVKERPSGQENKVCETYGTRALSRLERLLSRRDVSTWKEMPTGRIEVLAQDVDVYNICRTLPFEIKDFVKKSESLRMQFRYLDLRSSRLQKNLRLRSQLVMKMREYLCYVHGRQRVCGSLQRPGSFLLPPSESSAVQTAVDGGWGGQVLPGGSVLSRRRLQSGSPARVHPGGHRNVLCGPGGNHIPGGGFVAVLVARGDNPHHASLPNHDVPGGHEGLRGGQTRHQIWHEGGGGVCLLHVDISTPEIGWCFVASVMCVRVGKCLLLGRNDQLLWNQSPVSPHLSISLVPSSVQLMDIRDVFVSADAAFLKSGSSVLAIRVPDGATLFTAKDLEGLNQAAKTHFHQEVSVVLVRADGTLKSPVKKLLSGGISDALLKKTGAEPGDLLLIAAGAPAVVRPLLGHLRLRCADLLESHGSSVRDPSAFHFLWVVDFPLFVPKRDEPGRLESAHHPFTAPVPEDAPLLYTQPLKVRGQHYDLVLNGCEIGGGSIRIHKASEQLHVLKNILQEDPTVLSHLLEALDSGAPPHGGIALGLDRLVSIMVGAVSIRDVIAFPKSFRGHDLMGRAPDYVSEEELKPYHVSVRWPAGTRGGQDESGDI
ncbi:aspartate--tRNA ligase, mitochondrial-like isoform X1 [Dunckerocampus dactyliophorus]|uniref:aspartate--tRNA ligase, mitochondrial-like isoform X1 n=1 Tax=Dunckerocampus dactyliophorus TaxID=161453 RepID=UPI002404BC80|nr:aspartate--tRNA ligase, mitochondrial-like isoform X1 [Dunckerocampus dactyliophorus]